MGVPIKNVPTNTCMYFTSTCGFNRLHCFGGNLHTSLVEGIRSKNGSLVFAERVDCGYCDCFACSWPGFP